MNNELMVTIGRKKYKVFLQSGFYNSIVKPMNFHRHNFAEIHIIVNGNKEFNIAGEQILLKNGSLMIIPQKVFHSCGCMQDKALHLAFQIECEADKIAVYNIGADIILRFLTEIENCKLSGDYTKIAAYIALFANYLFFDEKLSVNSASDYGFLIYEFFSNQYRNDLHLSDLARLLHLSERQCERLVIEHTGNTFREQLTKTRMDMAKELLKTSKMSMSEIAEYVGYKSYAGFYKAMRKFQEGVKH